MIEELIISSLKGLALYLTIIIWLRVLGKKRVAEMSSIDMAFMVLLGSTLGQQMPEDHKFTGSLAAIFTLAAANFLLNLAVSRFEIIRRIVEDVSVVIVSNGKIDNKTMKKELITMEDLKQAMRENKIENIEEIKKAVLETTGKINILKKNKKTVNTKSNLKK